MMIVCSLMVERVSSCRCAWKSKLVGCLGRLLDVVEVVVEWKEESSRKKGKKVP